MEIRLKHPVCINGVDFIPGQELDLPADIRDRLIDKGWAEDVNAEPVTPEPEPVTPEPEEKPAKKVAAKKPAAKKGKK